MALYEDQLALIKEDNSALRESCAEYEKLFTTIVRMMVRELGADYVRCTVDEVDAPQEEIYIVGSAIKAGQLVGCHNKVFHPWDAVGMVCPVAGVAINDLVLGQRYVFRNGAYHAIGESNTRPDIVTDYMVFP